LNRITAGGSTTENTFEVKATIAKLKSVVMTAVVNTEKTIAKRTTIIVGTMTEIHATKADEANVEPFCGNGRQRLDAA
jgi:hypothetical protein